MDLTAFPVLDFSLARQPCLSVCLAIKAHVAARPSYLDKILQTGSVIYENIVEHFIIEWVCVHAYGYVKFIPMFNYIL